MPGESKLSPGLYIVATPIGNMRDITLRALDVLGRADVLACEDTRVTGKLLRHFGLTPGKVVAYHDHNAEAMRPRLMEALGKGGVVALVSDAGTPLVSDPGYKLVRAAVEAGAPVHALPGASASLAALVSSGLPSDRFLFAGFLPPRRAARLQALTELQRVPATIVVFESTRRLAATLADMLTAFGPRPAAVARELTKLYEEVRRGSLDELARHYAESGSPKGEAVIVVGPPAPDGPETDIDAMLDDALSRMSLRDAAETVSVATGQKKRDVYAQALARTRRLDRDEP